MKRKTKKFLRNHYDDDDDDAFIIIMKQLKFLSFKSKINRC